MRLNLRIAAAAVLAALSTSTAYAEQFVLLDAEFTYTKEDADNSSPSKSHYYVNDENFLNTERPDDWTSPIDYRNGTVHVHTEVIDKPPGGYGTQWTLCYIPNQGQDNGYGCTSTGQYTEEGVYDIDVPMTEWWENESIVWTEGIKQMDLVMKDDTGGSGFAHLRPDPENFFPTTVRIVMIQVSAGSTYDPSLVPGLNAGGSGGSGGTAGSAGGAEQGGAGSGGAGSGGLSGGAGGSAGSSGPGGAGSGGMPLAAGGQPAAAGQTASPDQRGALAPRAASEPGCSVAGRASCPSFSALLIGAAALIARRRRSVLIKGSCSGTSRGQLS